MFRSVRPFLVVPLHSRSHMNFFYGFSLLKSLDSICYEKNDLKLHKAGPRKLSPAPKFKKFWWGAKASTPSMLRMKPDASKDKESSCRVEISLKLRKNNRLAPGWGSNSTIITEIWRHPKTSKNVATHIQLFPKSPTRTSGVEFAWFTSLAVNRCKHKTKWKRLVDVNPPVESTTES